MCAISMIVDYMQQRVPINHWDKPSFELFERVMKDIEELDKLLWEPDCLDPSKQAYLEAVRDRLQQFKERA